MRTQTQGSELLMSTVVLRVQQRQNSPFSMSTTMSSPLLIIRDAGAGASTGASLSFALLHRDGKKNSASSYWDIILEPLSLREPHHKGDSSRQNYEERRRPIAMSTLRECPNCKRRFSSARSSTRSYEEHMKSCSPYTGNLVNDLHKNAPSSLGFQRDPDVIEPQPVAATLLTALQIRLNKVLGILRQLGNEVSTVTIGTGSFSVTLRAGYMLGDSCHVEYVESRNRWGTAHCPSNIELRRVEESELIQRCRDLITLAGCVFQDDRWDSETELEAARGSGFVNWQLPSHAVFLKTFALHVLVLLKRIFVGVIVEQCAVQWCDVEWFGGKCTRKRHAWWPYMSTRRDLSSQQSFRGGCTHQLAAWSDQAGQPL